MDPADFPNPVPDETLAARLSATEPADSVPVGSLRGEVRGTVFASLDDLDADYNSPRSSMELREITDYSEGEEAVLSQAPSDEDLAELGTPRSADSDSDASTSRRSREGRGETAFEPDGGTFNPLNPDFRRSREGLAKPPPLRKTSSSGEVETRQLLSSHRRSAEHTPEPARRTPSPSKSAFLRRGGKMVRGHLDWKQRLEEIAGKQIDKRTLKKLPKALSTAVKKTASAVASPPSDPTNTKACQRSGKAVVSAFKALKEFSASDAVFEGGTGISKDRLISEEVERLAQFLGDHPQVAKTVVAGELESLCSGLKADDTFYGALIAGGVVPPPQQASTLQAVEAALLPAQAMGTLHERLNTVAGLLADSNTPAVVVMGGERVPIGEVALRLTALLPQDGESSPQVAHNLLRARPSADALEARLQGMAKATATTTEKLHGEANDLERQLLSHIEGLARLKVPAPQVFGGRDVRMKDYLNRLDSKIAELPKKDRKEAEKIVADLRRTDAQLKATKEAILEAKQQWVDMAMAVGEAHGYESLTPAQQDQYTHQLQVIISSLHSSTLQFHHGPAPVLRKLMDCRREDFEESLRVGDHSLDAVSALSLTPNVEAFVPLRAKVLARQRGVALTELHPDTFQDTLIPGAFILGQPARAHTVSEEEIATGERETGFQSEDGTITAAVKAKRGLEEQERCGDAYDVRTGTNYRHLGAIDARSNTAGSHRGAVEVGRVLAEAMDAHLQGKRLSTVGEFRQALLEARIAAEQVILESGGELKECAFAYAFVFMDGQGTEHLIHMVEGDACGFIQRADGRIEELSGSAYDAGYNEAFGGTGDPNYGSGDLRDQEGRHMLSRSYSVGHTVLQPGDQLLLGSDGLRDNLEGEALGIAPDDPSLTGDHAQFTPKAAEQVGNEKHKAWGAELVLGAPEDRELMQHRHDRLKQQQLKGMLEGATPYQFIERAKERSAAKAYYEMQGRITALEEELKARGSAEDFVRDKAFNDLEREHQQLNQQLRKMPKPKPDDLVVISYLSCSQEDF